MRHRRPPRPLGDDADPTSRRLRAALTNGGHQLAAADHNVTLLTLGLIAHTVRTVSHRIAYVGLERPDPHPDRLIPAGTYPTGRHLFPRAERRRELDDAIADYTTQLTAGNEATWLPFTTQWTTSVVPPGAVNDPDECPVIGKILARTPDPAAV